MAWRKGQWGCNKYRRLAACLPIPEKETPNCKGQFLLKLLPCKNTPLSFSCTCARTHRHRRIIPKCASQNASDQLQPFFTWLSSSKDATFYFRLTPDTAGPDLMAEKHRAGQRKGKLKEGWSLCLHPLATQQKTQRKNSQVRKGTEESFGVV